MWLYNKFLCLSLKWFLNVKLLFIIKCNLLLHGEIKNKNIDILYGMYFIYYDCV